MAGQAIYWVAGEVIGDWSVVISFREMLLFLSYIVSDAGNRHSESLCEMPRRLAFDAIRANLYGEEDIDPEDEIDMAGRFDVLPRTENFSDLICFAFECGEDIVVTSGRFSNFEFYDVTLPKIEFEQSLRQCFQYLSSLDTDLARQ